MVKSVPHPAFYRLLETGPDGSQTLASQLWTAGPWTASAQHGGPPSALLVRAVERLPEAAGRVVGRVTVELWGPVPVAPLTVSARVVRPGRSVVLAEAEVVDPGSGRVAATARAWLFPRTEDGPGEVGPPLPHGPADGVRQERPPSWGAGYVDAVQWAWVSGELDRGGPAVVWMRPPPLVDGEGTSPLQRLVTCVDSASGAGSALDVADWTFLNTELSVHVLREPVGDWVCLDAATALGPGAVGIATSTVHDRLGPVARSAQALLVHSRP
jgi:hypothetical protein